MYLFQVDRMAGLMAKNRVLASQWSKLANMSMRHGSSVVGGPTLAQQKVCLFLCSTLEGE